MAASVRDIGEQWLHICLNSYIIQHSTTTNTPLETSYSFSSSHQLSQHLPAGLTRADTYARNAMSLLSLLTSSRSAHRSLHKHDAFINISGRRVWDVGTSLYHSRVHSSYGPTGSVLEASECEADRNDFSLMYCNCSSSQVELLFLGKYNIFSPVLPRERNRENSDCFPQEATLLTLRNATWVTSPLGDRNCSVASLKPVWVTETRPYYSCLNTHINIQTNTQLSPSLLLCIKVREHFSTFLSSIVADKHNKKCLYGVMCLSHFTQSSQQEAPHWAPLLDWAIASPLTFADHF